MSDMPESKREVVQGQGENLLQMPELPKDVVYCNVCNIDGDRQDGIIEGTVESALAAGWQERNWGMTCPKCQQELDEVEDSVVDSGGLKVLGNFLSDNLFKAKV